MQNPAIDDAAWDSEWYLEKASNSDVIVLLAGKPDGVFVIRDSSANNGDFTLSYRYCVPSYVHMCFNRCNVFF